MEHAHQLFDVIVIGAGVMGSSAAYQTSKRGLKTLLLEQFDFLHHRGSSHGESRTLRATYPEDYYSGMVVESSRLWQEAEEEVGYKVYFKTKQLDMGPSENKSLLAVIDSCHKNSIPVRVLTGERVLEEFSGMFDIPEDWIGVVTQHGGVIKPTKAVAMFQTLALRNGAVLRDNSEVIDINRDARTNEIIVFTAGGNSYRGGKCVITAGPWTRKLVKRVRGITLPIQPLETTVHYWKINQGHQGKFTIESGFPTFASYGEPYIYGTPSLEFPGLVKIPVHAGRVCEPEERTWAAPAALVEQLRGWISGRFGELVDVEKPVLNQSCMYSMTPDEDFVIDFLGGEFGEDAVVCGGFSGHGFKMAPVVGRIAAELVESGKVEGVDITHFKVGRFEGDDDCRGNAKDFDDQVQVTASAH
ncbi:FAD-dependent oxidoreductase family protein [Perilla frutescens var. hirtella]|nr:FAD-dependent oxidoreductase family protein [Perilla frutescens var. frutescens]KAH6783611.1 FAD-dependent oxidoreductase family protein [Perilla frutescens var. hirtella]